MIEAIAFSPPGLTKISERSVGEASALAAQIPGGRADHYCFAGRRPDRRGHRLVHRHVAKN